MSVVFTLKYNAKIHFTISTSVSLNRIWLSMENHE